MVASILIFNEVENFGTIDIEIFDETCEYFDLVWNTPYEKGDSIKVVETSPTGFTEAFWITFVGFITNKETDEMKIVGIVNNDLSGDFPFNYGNVVALDISCVWYNERTMLRVIKEWDEIRKAEDD